MMNLRKLDPITWGPDVTLGDLWRRWMQLNELKSTKDAQRALGALEIKGSGDLSYWLNNEPTNALLTMPTFKICELTGVDLDGWIVCEAKKLLITRVPELTERVDFSTRTSRESIVDELSLWAKRYDNKFLLAIQIGGGSDESLRRWLDKARMPSMEPLIKIIELLVRGPIEADTRVDLVYALICRVIFGQDPKTIFPGARTFHEACRLMLAPFKGYTPTRVAKEIDLGASATSNLLSWDTDKEPDPKFPYETIESVIRALLKRSYPQHVARFDELKQIYRSKQKQGIWEVPELLRLQEAPRTNVEAQPAQQQKTTDVAQIRPARFVQATAKASPSETEQPRIVVHAPTTDTHDNLAELLARGHELMAGVLRGKRYAEEGTGAEPKSVNASIGEMIDGVKHCMTRASFKRHTEVSLTSDQIEMIRRAIEQLRKIIVLIVSLEETHVQADIRPIIGRELFELFLGTRGLRLLLDSPEAFDIIDAERKTARIITGTKRSDD